MSVAGGSRWLSTNYLWKCTGFCGMGGKWREMEAVVVSPLTTRRNRARFLKQHGAQVDLVNKELQNPKQETGSMLA